VSREINKEGILTMIELQALYGYMGFRYVLPEAEQKPEAAGCFTEMYRIRSSRSEF
jgi:hypothetical protein